ncbi:ice-binding family protein [soil metagenome]
MKKKINIALTAVMMFLMPALIYAQTPPNLGTSSTFALFTSAGGVTNVGISQITGDVGTNSGLSSGFGNVNGVMHDNDGASASAAFDLNIAYLNLGGQIPTMFPGISLGLGQVLNAAVFSIPAVSTLNGVLTLDGLNDTNACFIFQLNGAFSSGPGASVVLTNGTKACNVFWRIDGATTFATGTTFAGTIICNGAITLASGCNLEGRALSQVGAVGITGTKVTTPLGCGLPYLTGPNPPNIGSLECYALLTEIGALTNTGTSTIIGDVGTNNGPVTGFGLPTIVIGTVHAVPDASTAQGSADLTILYNYLNSLPFDIELLYPVQFGNSQVLTPHVYRLKAAATLTDTIFLNAEGNSNAVFVIQINGALMTSTYSNVVLMNGTQSSNVFWQVEGSVDINNYSIFRGTIVANNGAISMFIGDTLDGRALSTTGAITTHDVNLAINSVAPTVTPSGPLTFCQGDSVTLTASVSISYLWSTGATTQSITVYNSGNYSVTTTGNCGNSTNSLIITVIVNPAPIASITPSGPTIFCAGDSVILTSSPGTSYLWSTLAITQSITVTASGNYSVTVSNGSGCTANSPITIVTVNPMPIATITANGPLTFCQGDSVILTSGIATSYLWSTNAITQSITVTTSGNYYVIASNGGGCSDTSAITSVLVNPAPIATITANGPLTFCQGDSVILTASNGLSWLWSTGDTSQSITIYSSGNYTVAVTNACGSVTSSVVTVTINLIPTAGFSSGTTAALTYTFTNASTNATSYSWNFGDSQTSTAANPTNVYATDGTYTVILIASNACGSDTAIQIISTYVIINPELEFFNGFSPNGDGQNDYWNIPVLNYYPTNSVLIINRWGDEVWKGIDYNNSDVAWTGQNMKGKDLPDGTYYYIISYNDILLKGWVFVKR